MSKIDEVDRRIIRELQIDARRSNKALAEAAGVSPPTALARVRALESRGVIRGYHAAVDPVSLGREVQAIVSVRIQPKSEAVLRDIVDRVWALDETVAVTLVTGSVDMLVHLAVSDISTLSERVLMNIASLPNVVDEQTSIVFEHRDKHVWGTAPHGVA